MGGAMRAAVCAAAAGGAAAVSFPAQAGLNVPWNSFGYDIGGGAYDPAWFETYFGVAQNNSQNVARFWVHCDGRAGLKFNGQSSVTGLTDSFTQDLKGMLGIAQRHNVVVQLCLWSFDMCKDETSQGHTNAWIVSNEAAARSYVDNALTPMLSAVAGFPNVIIETINEPEWCMSGPGNTQDIVQPAAMQRFVAMIAEAAHKAGRKVTTGSASLKWSSHASEAEASYWDDAALKQAYPSSSTGSMDFYNVHYYDWMYNDQWGYDPMRADTAHWQLDKPCVVAEMPVKSDHYSVEQILDKSTNNGFKGVMFWAYNDPSFPIEDCIVPLTTYAQAQHASYQAVLDYLAFNPQPTPAPAPTPAPVHCADPPPDSQYTCAEQKSWGKCDVQANPWMAGYCCETCFHCAAGCGNAAALLRDALPRRPDRCPSRRSPPPPQRCCKTCFNCTRPCGG